MAIIWKLAFLQRSAAMPKRTPEEIRPTLKLYSALMGEVRARLDAVSVLLRPDSKLPAPIVRECCYLQFRMICEVIALGCLTAHDDIEAVKTGKMTKAYAADWIMKQLDSLHTDFYPRPVVLDASGAIKHFTPVPEGFLTKGEFLKLYARCGDHLHRGSLKKLLTPRMPTETAYSDLREILASITGLVSEHLVLRSDRKSVIVTKINSSPGQTSCAYAEARDV
jgi:hypothetical protein